jgi:hypothetical protein
MLGNVALVGMRTEGVPAMERVDGRLVPWSFVAVMYTM